MGIKSEKKADDMIDIARECRSILSEKKAVSTVIMDMYGVHSDFDFFIITVANSQIHCKSLAKEVRKYLNEAGFAELSRPDFNSGWIALDFEGIVVHVFTESVNEYYRLEKLWADAKYIN